MNRKVVALFKKARIIILLIALLLTVIAVNPTFSSDGVAIRGVAKDSAAEVGGIAKPKPTDPPRSREVIHAINDAEIKTLQDYHTATEGLLPNETVFVETNRQVYRLITQPLYETVHTGEYHNVTRTELIHVNETDANGTVYLVNQTVNKTAEEEIIIRNIIGTEDLGLSVYEKPMTNIRKGIDLQGGTRVWLRPETVLEQEDMAILIANMEQRLNVYGLSDLTIREASDLGGEQYILVEIAGTSEQQVKELLARQGKFEAKIGNDTVFYGGKDITHVCRTAECSGLDPNYGCQQSADSTWLCRFRFSISLTPEAAARQAAETQYLECLKGDTTENSYLERDLDLYLDDQNVETLKISCDLKGQATTEISISGSGQGLTGQEAQYNTLQEMKTLQTILITGSLPVKLEIVKTDSLSPVLGKEFVRNAIIVGILAVLAVGIVVFIRYRKFAISIPMMAMCLAEGILLLGIAALIGWNLDLAAIAGIIVAIGTGVDDQIVIADETLRGHSQAANWKEKLKRAFFIIMGSYFTTVAAMIPLIFAGAGLLKGFAIITIIGVSIGVFITRPAFGAIIEVLLKE